MGNNLIRVAIADDQSIFRNGVIATLKPYPHLVVTCDANNGTTLLEKLKTATVDVLLLDMKMPDMDGVQVCKSVKQLYPQIHVIGFSVYDHHYYISSMFEAGASGYLLKDIDALEIVRAIETVMKDGNYLHENASLPLIQKLISLNHPSVYYDAEQAIPLKPYEIDILKHVANGLTAVEIAEHMKLSSKTIENYRTLMMAKVGAKNIAGLVTYAIKKGIVLV
jgi:DNA-binding NarL/FixJ family response regulator